MARERPLGGLTVTVTLKQPTFHGFRELKIRPGVIDDAAIELYAYCYCALLARALHWRSGWPLALVERVEPSWCWEHVGVFTPAGDVLDIHGIRSVEQVAADFDRELGRQVRLRPLYTLDDLFTVIGEREADRQNWIAGKSTLPLFAELTGVFADSLMGDL